MSDDPATRIIRASVEKTYEWIADVEQELPTTGRQTACHALRGALPKDLQGLWEG